MGTSNFVTYDCLILGSGPAGLSAARALAARGATTAVIAPDPHAAWPATYGAWTDRLPEYALAAAAARFENAAVDLGDRRIVLDRPYTRLHTPGLHRLLLDRAVDAGVELVAAEVSGAEHDRSGSTVRAGDREIRASVVIDATGTGVLLGGRQPTLFQTAYGVLAEVDGPLEGLRWMDFSHRHGDGTEPATFLYAMPMPDGRLFLEETSLARAGGMPFDLLKERLERRLAAENVRVRAVHEVEHCRIALDREVPRAQRVVGFGAAGGMVHPATGYSLTRVLALAEPLADAIVSGLADGGPASAASAAWSTLWPADRRRRWALYRFGSAAAASLGADQVRRFFGAFFDGPRWAEWLDDELSLPALSREMAALYGRLPVGVGLWLVAHGFHSLEAR